MPQGPVLAEEKYAKLLMNLKKTAGEAFARVEAPRGEDMHYVRMNGKQEPPEMWKVKASTYSNQMAWIEILQGEQIADIPIIVASIDPCMSCTDRVAVVDTEGTVGVLTKEHLHRLSVEKTRRLMA
jgi:membrane-bound hydrogenase subunit alpha